MIRINYDRVIKDTGQKFKISGRQLTMMRVYREGNNSATSKSLCNKRVEPRTDDCEDSQDGVKTWIAVYTS